jgi:hypothetical protein
VQIHEILHQTAWQPNAPISKELGKEIDHFDTPCNPTSRVDL